MSEYQYLNPEIRVPKEWPVEIGRQLFEDLVKNATSRYRKSQRVVVTVKNVSAVVTKFTNKPGYLLEKTEEINDERTHRLDVIFPAKVVMLKLKPDGSNQGEEESVQRPPMILKSDHFISSMLVMNHKNHKVMTFEPDIEKILTLKGITGPERYDYGFQTTYTFQKTKCLDDNVPEIKPTLYTSTDPSKSQEQVTDDTWNIVTFDKLSPPKRFRCSWKAASLWICYSVTTVLIILLIYLCVIITRDYEDLEFV